MPALRRRTGATTADELNAGGREPAPFDDEGTIGGEEWAGASGRQRFETSAKASHNALKSASEELKDALREHLNVIQQARRELAQEKDRLNLESTPTFDHLSSMLDDVFEQTRSKIAKIERAEGANVKQMKQLLAVLNP